jgi:hypothetical protein
MVRARVARDVREAHLEIRAGGLTLFAYAEIWLMLMLMLKCCERKILFHG